MGIRRIRAVSAVLNTVDALAQRIVPPKAERIAWVSDPDYIGNAFHLYRHVLTTRPGIEHVWLTTDPAAKRRIERDLEAFAPSIAPGSSVRVARRHSAIGYWRRLRCRLIFHTHGLYPMSTAHRRAVVSLWHGMPVKCIGALNTISPDPHPTFGTMHVATSHLFRHVIAAAFQATPDQVLRTGLPRCDVLTDPHPLAPSRAAIRTALGVPPDDRLIVWLPTYRTPGHRRDAPPGVAGFQTFLDDLSDEEWQRIDQLAAQHGCRIVMKLHPHDPLNDVDFDLGRERIRLLRSAEWLETGIELYDMLAATDGLISDVSSVLIDYLATSRPLGIIGFDPDTYTRDVVFPVAALLASSRIHDLADEAAVVDFFVRVGRPERSVVHDDLSPWLNDVERGAGCETVLAAVGL